MRSACFFFNDTATTEIYTLSLHDALPIWDAHDALLGGGLGRERGLDDDHAQPGARLGRVHPGGRLLHERRDGRRSEEHTSELQSRQYLVCRLLLEKKSAYTAPRRVAYCVG